MIQINRNMELYGISARKLRIERSQTVLHGFQEVIGGENGMKVEIITIQSMNYGNRLQNYALQKYLEKRGITVRTTCGRQKDFLFLRDCRDFLLRFYRKTDKELFLYFDTKIKWKKKSLPPYADDEQIDYYIAGSDQIWNPLFASCRDDKFLTFVPEDKRIAYAASIGLDTLPDSVRDRFRTHILNFKAVSVREKAAQEIILDLCGRKVPVVPDPTMLLTADEWMEATKTSVINIREPYIIMYFLGIRNPVYDQYVKQYAQKHGCRIIDITKHEACGIPGVGPEEFVRLFANCQAAFVDSFHGTVFSVLFRKQFLTFCRPDEEGFGNMNSRFVSLLEMLGLTDRYVSSPYTAMDVETTIDYDSVHERILEQREKTEEFFYTAFQ